jgi:hypothetical protein
MEEEVTRGIEVRARGRVASQKAYLARERAKKARADQIAGRVSRFLFTELCTELAVMTGGERKRHFRGDCKLRAAGARPCSRRCLRAASHSRPYICPMCSYDPQLQLHMQ